MVSTKESLSGVEEKFVHRLEAELGDYFHLALSYNGPNSRLLHLNQTAEVFTDPTGGPASEPATLVENLRDEGVHRGSGQSIALGEHQCTLHLYTELLLLHFQETDSGLIIGVDSRSATNLQGFLEDISPAVSGILATERPTE